jgi:ABC-type Zn uptake system ZnuABC Zn-binding protein ZnuA
MKAFFLTLLLALASAANTANAAEPARPFVLTTIFPLHQIAKNIAGDSEGIRLELLLAAEAGCPHDYALTPGEMLRFAEADAIVTNGLGMEEFLETALAHAGGTITVHDTSASVSGEKLLPLEAAYNPHLFASPLAQAKIGVGLAHFFAALDPAGQRVYRANATRYAAEMRALAEEMTAAVAALPNRRVVASHEIFDYLARDIGLEIVDRVGEGVPSAARLMALAGAVRERGAAALLAEPQYPARTAEVLADGAGIPVLLLDPVATGPADAPPDYFASTMRRNADTLTRALGAR